MDRYDITVRSSVEDRFYIRLSDSSRKITVKLDTLTPHKELTESIPEANIMVLDADNMGTLKTATIGVLHRMRTRDRIAVDGKERLYVSLENRLALGGDVFESSEKTVAGQSCFGIKAFTRASAVSPTKVGQVDDLTATDLDALTLEDIDYTET